MYEDLKRRLEQLVNMKPHDNGMGIFLFSAENVNAIRECAAEAADAIATMNMRLLGDNAAIAGMKREIERMVRADKSRWIPVTERLPESGTRALVMRFDFVTNTPFYDLLWFDKGEWWNRRYTGDYAVTHWMPLPEPPKEE